MLRVNENEVVSTIIRTGIDQLDEIDAILEAVAHDEREDAIGNVPPLAAEFGYPNEPASATPSGPGPQIKRVLIGSRRPGTTVAELSVLVEIPTLRTKINKFLSGQLGGRQIISQDHPVSLQITIRRTPLTLQFLPFCVLRSYRIALLRSNIFLWWTGVGTPTFYVLTPCFMANPDLTSPSLKSDGSQIKPFLCSYSHYSRSLLQG